MEDFIEDTKYMRDRVNIAYNIQTALEFATEFSVTERQVNYALKKLFGRKAMFHKLHGKQKEVLAYHFLYLEKGIRLEPSALNNLNSLKLAGSLIIEAFLKASSGLVECEESPLDVIKAMPKELITASIEIALMKQVSDNAKLDELAKQMPMLKEIEKTNE